MLFCIQVSLSEQMAISIRYTKNVFDIVWQNNKTLKDFQFLRIF